MRPLSVASAVLFAILAISASAFAGDLERNVSANRTSRVHAFTVADRSTCAAAGKPKMAVSTEPKHGKVSFKWEYIRAGKKFRNCAGGQLKVMSVYYTPASGFRGTDSFTVAYSFPKISGYVATGNKSKNFVLNVK